ncbi:MAG: hypothetical protein ACI92C_002765 [Neolewinella sp.]
MVLVLSNDVISYRLTKREVRAEKPVFTLVDDTLEFKE